MKRVMVIDKDKFQDALRVAMKESSDKFALRDRFMRILYDFKLPGNLLAEFEQKANWFRNKVGFKTDLCVVFEESEKIKQGQPVHVLILGEK